MATDERDENPFVQLIASQKIISGRYENPTILNGSQGAFSLVFTAEDTRTKESVVLKFLDPACDPYREACFRREIDVCKRLIGRENIVQVRGELGTLTVPVTYPGIPRPVPWSFSFFALERASQDLASYLLSREHPAPLYRRLEITRHVVKGVNRLHNAGFCHRDLKPDNILLFQGGVAKLGDLGTSRSLEQEDPLLGDYGHPVGARWYAAPELICGGWNNRELYKGSDWFAVGAILFESLAGVNLYIAVGLRDDQLIDMIGTFGSLPAPARLAKFEQHVADIAGRYPIPSLHDYHGEPWLAAAPEETLDALDNAVKCLCHFDHRRRWQDFNTIFRNIDICVRRARFDESKRARRLLRGKRG